MTSPHPPHFWFAPPADRPETAPLGDLLQSELARRAGAGVPIGDGRFATVVNTRDGVESVSVIHPFPYVEGYLCVTAQPFDAGDTVDPLILDQLIVCEWCGDTGRLSNGRWVSGR